MRCAIAPRSRPSRRRSAWLTTPYWRAAITAMRRSGVSMPSIGRARSKFAPQRLGGPRNACMSCTTRPTQRRRAARRRGPPNACMSCTTRPTSRPPSHPTTWAAKRMHVMHNSAHEPVAEPPDDVGRQTHACHAQLGPRAGASARHVGRQTHACHAQVGPRRVWRGAHGVGRAMHACHAQVGPHGGRGAAGAAWAGAACGRRGVRRSACAEPSRAAPAARRRRGHLGGRDVPAALLAAPALVSRAPAAGASGVLPGASSCRADSRSCGCSL